MTLFIDPINVEFVVYIVHNNAITFNALYGGVWIIHFLPLCIRAISF